MDALWEIPRYLFDKVVDHFIGVIISSITGLIIAYHNLGINIFIAVLCGLGSGLAYYFLGVSLERKKRKKTVPGDDEVQILRPGGGIIVEVREGKFNQDKS